MSNHVKRAIDANLSCLHASSASRAAILEKVQGGKTMKKRLSLGFILALVIVLVVIGALAAVILTNKEFVDTVLSPKAAMNSQDYWTQAEMEDILILADKNGVVVPQDVRDYVSSQKIHYKSEIMRVFAKAQLGFYPSTWSIEDQAWYDQILLESGLVKSRSCFVPEGQEISEEKALETVNRYIQDTFDPNACVTDATKYRRHVTYQMYIDNPYSKGKRWYIEYEPLSLDISQYTLMLQSDGAIYDAQRVMGALEEGRKPLMPDEVLDLYREQYGINKTWRIETWIAFHRDLSTAVKRIGGIDSQSSLGLILQQHYSLPDINAIPLQEALKTASSAAANVGGPSEAELENGYTSNAIYLIDVDQPVWKVTLTKNGQTSNIIAYLYEINAITGSVINTDTLTQQDRWYKPYILKRQMPIAATPTPTSTPRADGMPKIWYSTIAPAYYWEALDAVGYNSATAAQRMTEWENTYGSNRLFWPLEAQAIDIIWHEMSEGATTLPGLPAPDDITQTQAEETAKNALHKYKALDLGEDTLRELKTTTSFTFNAPQMGDRVWNIHFIKVTQQKTIILEEASVDAKTGKIIYATWLPPQPTPTPALAADGRPVWWYDDRVPDYFWQAMDATGYNASTMAELDRKWEDSYGKETMLWPLLEQAVFYLWRDDIRLMDQIAGLPAPGDMKESDAITLAVKALKDRFAQVAGDEYIESLIPAVGFHISLEEDEKGRRNWFIQFVKTIPTDGITYGYVLIDAQTGEILQAELQASYG